MKSIFSLVLMLIFVPTFHSSNAVAQDNPNLEIGLKPYGSFRGGNIDTISMNNGNLNVRIPIWSVPQRGGVGLSFSLVYNNKGYTIAKRCPPTGCYYQWSPNGLFGFQFVEDQRVTATGSAIYHSTTLYAYTASASTSDGAVHQMGQKGTTSQWETLDGTGIAGTNFHNDPNAGVYRFDSVIDRNGVRHHYPSSTEGPGACSEDSNGNVITCNFALQADIAAYTDTLGRSIGPRTITSDYSSCSGTLPTVQAETLSFPAPNGGTATFKLCYASITLQTNFQSFGHREYSGSKWMLQSVVLPNLTTWTFTYDNGGFGDLIGIQFPTGGSLAYTWGTQPLCGNSYPNLQQTPASRVITSRSVNANDGSGPHVSNYNWGSEVDTGSSRTRVDTVTDAALNDIVYTETGLGNSCSFFETQRQVYTGTGAARTLAQTITTDYTWLANQFDGLSSVAANTVLNVEPVAVTQSWPNGKTSKVSRSL